MASPQSAEQAALNLASMDPASATDALVLHAVNVGASDLFLMSEERSMNVSLRRLGAIELATMVSQDQGRHLINHIKALAGMDIAEHRRALDGRLIFTLGEKKIDVRINCIPTLFGEDLALRIFDRDIGLRSIDDLGMQRDELGKLMALLDSPSGLLLISGPTGVGKTTTLYACMRHLNDGKRKINTLEDPVEYAVEGVRQSQVQPKLGLDFAELLRSVLRQAPDVIMVGEIRDQETAATAVRAANSGLLVLATAHAPGAASAVQSMLALGAHPYFLGSCLLGVVAQRLVRVLCEKCRQKFDISGSPETFADIQPLLAEGAGSALYGPGGCELCHNSGYIKRQGVFELMTMNHEIRALVAEEAKSDDIEQAAVCNGMTEFRRGALLRVANGVTSIEEMLRCFPADFLGLED